jgi:hypothetical protein
MRELLTERVLGCAPRHHGPTSPYAKDHHHERHRARCRVLVRTRGAPHQLQAKESRRTGRHEPIRSSTTRIATRGAGLGITLAAGVAAGINYLEHDLQLSLLAGGQVGTVAAGMAFVGAWTERRRMTRVAKAASSLAVQLAADGTPDDEAAAQLLALKGTDRVALEQAARRTAGNPDTGRALGLLGRVAVLRALL